MWRRLLGVKSALWQRALRYDASPFSMTADGQKLVACWSRREPPDEHRSPATNRRGRPASSGVSTLERRIGPCLPASNVGWAGADGSWMAGAEQIKGSQLVSSCRGRRDKGALCWPRWETQMERHPQHGPGPGASIRWPSQGRNWVAQSPDWIPKSLPSHLPSSLPPSSCP